MTSAAPFKSKTQLEVERLSSRADDISRGQVGGSTLARIVWLAINLSLALVAYQLLEQSEGIAWAARFARLPSLDSVSRYVHPSVAGAAAGTLTVIQRCAARVALRTWADIELFRTAAAASLLVGFLGTARYHHNRKVKNEKNQRLALIPGKLGTQYLLHNIPRWLSYNEREKTEWLNTLIQQAWPYYDKAICDEIRVQVEPMLDEYRPSFIKRISFAKLTFGDSPFRIEDILVHDQDLEDPIQSIEFEVSFRWSGDANIHLAIDLQGGGAITRMVPKVTDLAVSGCARILLSPLIPEIPGFSAATVALMRPPEVKFHLDFGKAFGGSLSANAVVNWLDPFLRETLRSLLVWPRRVVVPLSDMTSEEASRLYMISRGALEVKVKKGHDLPRTDLILGQCDPKLRLYVDPLGMNECTSKKSNTLTPEWDETFWLMVQEPDDQFLHVTLLDVDTINVMALFRANLIKGIKNIIGSETVVSRGKLPLAEFADSPGVTMAVEIPLGDEDFSNPAGCGIGKGVIGLDVTYWPLEVMSGHASEPIGALLITLMSAQNAPISDVLLGTSDVYAVFTCENHKKTSSIMRRNCNPEWIDAKFEYYKIRRTSTLVVELFDNQLVTWDRKIGWVDISIDDISRAAGGDVTKSYEMTTPDGYDVPNPEEKTRITLRLQVCIKARHVSRALTPSLAAPLARSFASLYPSKISSDGKASEPNDDGRSGVAKSRPSSNKSIDHNRLPIGCRGYRAAISFFSTSNIRLSSTTCCPAASFSIFCIADPNMHVSKKARSRSFSWLATQNIPFTPTTISNGTLAPSTFNTSIFPLSRYRAYAGVTRYSSPPPRRGPYPSPPSAPLVLTQSMTTRSSSKYSMIFPYTTSPSFSIGRFLHA